MKFRIIGTLVILVVLFVIVVVTDKTPDNNSIPRNVNRDEQFRLK